jgi:hypothetical protein
MSKLLTLKHIGDAPVAQLDRASGYEPSRRKLISAAFGVACTKAHGVSAPSSWTEVGPKLVGSVEDAPSALMQLLGHKDIP